MEERWFVKKEDLVAVQQKPGLIRRTMSYNDQIMMCLFEQDTGVEVQLHSHEAVQNGYVISGKLKFFKEDGSFVIAEAGDSYTFDSNEPHGSVCLEHALFVENFTPMRKEYI